MKQTISLTESELHRIVKESVTKLLRENNNINNFAHHFDLDQTSKAYELGGKKTHWTDYSNGDADWDEESYYADFDAWWDGLPTEGKERIYRQLGV